MNLRTETLDGWAVVRVDGDVDVATAPRLRTHVVSVISDGQPCVVLDLDGVEFLDSTGLGVVVSALKRTRSQGGDLRLVCTRPAVQKLFELTGLDRTIPLHASPQEAIAGPVPASD